MYLSIGLHLLAAIIWVGGMFFAYMALRPAAAQTLQPPERLQLWVNVFKLFFVWVWFSIIVLLISGYWMIFSVYGGFSNIGTEIHIMHTTGLVMMFIFCYVFFVPYRRLRLSVAIEDYAAGAEQLASIRKLVAINLSLGLLTAAVAAAGRYI